MPQENNTKNTKSGNTRRRGASTRTRGARGGRQNRAQAQQPAQNAAQNPSVNPSAQNGPQQGGLIAPPKYRNKIFHLRLLFDADYSIKSLYHS